MESEKFKSEISDFEQKRMLWKYYYQQKDYKKAFEISKDSQLTNQYFIQVVTYAQLGNRKKVDSINKTFTWGDELRRGQRALIHAVLKDRDSMYFYLETEPYDRPIVVFTNGRNEFDPYRNEDRYKAFLRKWYLPVPGE